METLDLSFLTGTGAPIPEVQWDFTKEQEETQRMFNSWKTEESKAETRRNLRRFDVNMDEKRKRMEIEPDETYIPIRAIDQAIGNIKPSQIAFLESSKRLVIFTDVIDPTMPCEDLEMAFTAGMRYTRWNVAWHKAFDATDLHGASFLDIRFDDSKPLHCSVEHVSREFLIFPDGTKDIQQCERVARIYEYTAHELEGFVKTHGFNQAEVQRLVDVKSEKRNELIKVARVYKKVGGVVWVYWTTERTGSQDFLKAPVKLQLGLYDLSMDPMMIAQYASQGQEIPQRDVEFYPVVMLPFEIIEDELITNIKGCAAKELSTQEALTELWTNMVNASKKSSRVYASVENSPNGEIAESLQAKPLPRSGIYQRALKFWNFPPPDPSILQIAQSLSTVKLQEQGQVNFAAMNRKDSRKTAEEISSATQAQQLAMSADVATVSIAVREVYTICWNIAQSQIFIGAISDFPIDREKVMRLYKLSAAGDVDVIQRNELKQLIQNMLPMMSGTSIGPTFLKFAMSELFPQHYQKMQQEMDITTQLQSLVSALAQALQAAPRDQLTPQENQQLDGLIQSAQSVVPAQPGAPTNGSGSMDEPSNNGTA